MSGEKKRRGPKPSGKPRARGINFSVSAEHEAWLKQLPDRSAWLAEVIEKSKIDSEIDQTGPKEER